MMHRRAFLVGTAATLFVGGGLSRASGIASIQVGGSLSLTGPLRKICQPIREGLELWADEVNAAGGLRGQAVVLKLLDDAGDPGQAQAIYRGLVTESNLLVSPYGSYLSQAVIDLVEGSGVPMVVHSAASPALWEPPRRSAVQMLTPAPRFLEGAVEVAKQAGAVTAALVYQDDPFTRAVLGGVRDLAAAAGLKVVSFQSYQETREVPRILATLPPVDLLLGGGYTPGEGAGGFQPAALALTQGAGAVGLRPILLGALIAPSFPEFGNILGKEAEGICGNTGWKPYLRTPDNAGFVARYRARFGREPDAHAAGGYAAGQVLARAVEAAKDLRRVGEALFQLETTTIFGRYRVDGAGRQVGKVNALIQWQGGRPETVWPPWLATAAFHSLREQ
ncbi:MAG: amino acid ABC transporter substrate-binding protein [Candidatus Methylomirabilales bacterium]